MRYAMLFTIILIAFSCKRQTDSTIETKRDTITIDSKTLSDTNTVSLVKRLPQKKYSNKRFREVTVTKSDTNQFQITGIGQIFEASFGWVIEDGHNELQEGHEMTDAGAPEWGNFNFTVSVDKARENSTLMIILYETSAMDGSRQYELPIPLK